MTEQRCKHDILPGQCSLCRGLDDRAFTTDQEFASRPGRTRHEEPRRVVAVYASRCPECARWIKADDPITLNPETEEWVCGACGDAL